MCRVDSIGALIGNVEIESSRTGTIRITLNRDEYPDSGSIQLSTSADTWIEDTYRQIEVNQREFVFENVPPGAVSVLLVGRPIPLDRVNGAFTNKPLSTWVVIVEEGETSEVEFD